VAVLADGTLGGVRVVAHKETPGLGDKIEVEKGDWIHSFAGKSISNPDISRWKVKRDGGDFDQFSGATITPRAIVKAVKNTLLYYQEHSQELYATAPKEKAAKPAEEKQPDSAKKADKKSQTAEKAAAAPDSKKPTNQPTAN